MLTLGELFEIRNWSAFEETEEPVAEAKERTVTGSKLTEGLD
jgi:hypothetical protein